MRTPDHARRCSRSARSSRYRPWRSARAHLLSAGLGAQKPAREQGKLPPLARYFPGQDLVVYVEFDGLESHQRVLAKDGRVSALERDDHGCDVPGRRFPGSSTMLMREQTDIPLERTRAHGAGPAPFPVRVCSGHQPRRRHRPAAIVCGGGSRRGQGRDSPASRPRAASRRHAPLRRGRRAKAGGRTVHQIGAGTAQALAWWAEGDDLVISLVSPESADAVIDALDGRVQNAVAHPTRQALCKATMAGIRARRHWLFRHGRASPAAQGGRVAWASTGSSGSTIAGGFTATRCFRSSVLPHPLRERASRRSSISRNSTSGTCRRFRAGWRISRSSRLTNPSSAPPLRAVAGRAAGTRPEPGSRRA